MSAEPISGSSLASYHCSTPGSVLLLRSLTLPSTVPLEDPRRRELAELVADHVLRDEQLHELPPVVHQERMPDELRDDGAVARPGLDRLAVPGGLALDLGQQARIDVRSFLE